METTAKKSREGRQTLRRAVIKEFGRITENKNVSLQTKADTIHTLVFPTTMYGCESWTAKKADRKKN